MQGRNDHPVIHVCLRLAIIGAFGAPFVQCQNTIALPRPHGSGANDRPARSDFKVDSTVVLIQAAVTDARGRFVTGLQREDFQIFEDKVEQQVRYFSAEEPPVSIGLVLDFSSSMASKFTRLREAVAEFLKTANPQDEFCLVEFRDRAEVSLRFPALPDSIQTRLALAQPRGHTALLDAVELGLRQMRNARNPRRALLIVSDGGDNHSRLTTLEVEKRARESDVEIYAIGIERRILIDLADSEASMESSALRELSRQGGGEYYAAGSSRDLPSIAEQIGRELRHEYVLGYIPANPAHDGKYRRVQLKIQRSPGSPRLWARWKRGYYAPAE
ncbi:MAG TPA: VWA domain-containing protein [Bryobacteraceae bacterium]|nr:VWA domain-containing protein [Bryobacteraceae bacterium]